MRRSAPLHRHAAPGLILEDLLYLLDIEADVGRAGACLAICSLALDAFDTFNQQNRLLIVKLRSDSYSANTLDLEQFLRLAMETWPNEAFPQAGGRPGDPACVAPQSISVIQDGHGKFDFFWCDDGDFEFAPVFSDRPGIPRRSAAALALLFPGEAARATAIFHEFFGAAA